MTSRLFEVDDYFAKKLTLENDIDNLQSLCEACCDYYIMMSGNPPASTEAIELFNDVPPNVELNNKFLIGIYNKSNEMAGLIDMVKDFPEEGTWFIGQLMIKPELRKQGLGSLIMKSYQEWVGCNGAKRVSLSVVEKNKDAFRFWNRIGFEVEDTKYLLIGDKKKKVFVMKKDI